MSLEVPARIFYHGRYRRRSLFWLSMALLFGGPFVIVYVTMPGAPVADLIGGIVLGMPLFILSLSSLGRYKAVILLPEVRRFRFVSGLFQRRSTEEHDYARVVRIDVVEDRTPGGRSAPGGIDWVTRITLSGGRTIDLEEPSRAVANDHVAALRSEMGLVHSRSVG